jgi:hypothetical protein
LAEYVLLEAIQKGRKAFGQDAFMDWRKMPEFDPIEEMEQQKKFAKGEVFLYKRVLKLLKQTWAYKQHKIRKDPPKVWGGKNVEEEIEEMDLGKEVEEALEVEQKVSEEAKALLEEEEKEEEKIISERESLLKKGRKEQHQQVYPSLFYLEGGNKNK